MSSVRVTPFPLCPLCSRSLIGVTRANAKFYKCDLHGVWAPLNFFAAFRSTAHLVRELIDSRNLSVADSANDRHCPTCSRAMIKTAFIRKHELVLDQCVRCNGVWLDTAEAGLVETPLNSSSNVPLNWPSQAAGEQAQFHPAMLFNLPALESVGRVRSLPLATYFLILACAALTMKGFSNFEFISQNAFLPVDAFRKHGFTFFSATFLHSNWVHLLSNAYFLYVCGGSIEDLEGPLFTTVLFLASSAAGFLTYLYFFPAGLYSIGASGGIYGLMVYFAFTFPKNRVSIGFQSHRSRYRDSINPYNGMMAFSIPVPYVIFGYVCSQVLSANIQLSQSSQNGGANAVAHLGGALFGFLAYGLVGRTSVR